MTIQPPFDSLLEALRVEGILVDELPVEVVGPRLRPETWIADDLDPLTSRTALDLPTWVAGARIDGIPVLFGMLKGEPVYEAVWESLRRYRNQALIARSWLDGDATNLQLFLSTPPDSAGAPAWEEIAGLIEADDRICRKLVWLVPIDTPLEGAAAFLARTFLATPWKGAVEVAASRLDSMSAIELPPGWLEAVVDPALDADSLVLRLMEADAT